jgi:endonuclease/exonuclease/phosphatase family metal-dependent hydrolase
MERVKVLTYNTLHGLETGRWTVRAGESKEARAARLKVQFQQLASIQPDLMLFQEVNPLPEMAGEYVAALRESGLQYTEVHQVDSCGVRLAPGLAVVPGLNNGLAVLAKAPLKLRKVKGLKLSGGFGGCNDFMGLQTGEFRYALIAEIENPGTGIKILAVSLHLHSGIERDALLIRKIKEAEEQGRIRPGDLKDLVKTLKEGQARRLEEIRVLVKELSKLRERNDYLGVIIGGDFNFEPGSPEYRELEGAGLKNTSMVAGHSETLYSYDPQRNIIAGKEEMEVPVSLRQAVRGLPDRDQQKIFKRYRETINQARRIDFMFLLRTSSDRPKGCLQQEIFGQPTAVSPEPGSDHYGVLDTYITDSSQC